MKIAQIPCSTPVTPHPQPLQLYMILSLQCLAELKKKKKKIPAELSMVLTKGSLKERGGGRAAGHER